MIDGGGVLVVVPVFEEETTIGPLVRALHAQGFPVVVVDDASNDRSVEMARQADARVLELPWRMGAWGAAQAGIRLGVRDGFGCIVTIDGDGQHDPGDIAKLLAPIAGAEADIAIGSCIGRGTVARRLAWLFFRRLTGLAIMDFTSGYRAYRREAACLLLNDEATLFDYQDLGVLLCARRNALRMCEVPLSIAPRGTGKSHIFSSWLKVARYLVYTLSIACTRR